MRSVAYHESSHAVLAHMTGIYLLDGVDITGDTRAAVHTIRLEKLMVARMKDFDGRTIDHERELAIIYAAGFAGEIIFCQKENVEPDEKALHLGAHGDLLMVRELLGVQVWFSIIERASFYLRNPAIWSVVDVLANSILERNGVMSGDQMKDIIHNAFVYYDVPDCQVLS